MNRSRANEEGGSSPSSETQKRRQQVYQAQKRHRNRKAGYVTSLESEIARLRHLVLETKNEKITLAHQNQVMREVLASKSLDAQLGAIDLSAPPSTLDQSSDSVNLRLDEQLESDRWFVDMIDSEDLQQWTSSEASGLESQDQFVSGSNPIEGDSWAALDFILALEWPCRNHVHHPLINLNAWVPGVGELYGHAMTTTAAVFAGALYPSGSGQSSRREWVLPHAEIDKLVELSAKLAVNDTDITPAQAYSAVRQAVPSHRFLRPILQALKQPLGKVVHRTHFGSLLDATLFWEHFNVTLQSMQFTVPELSGRQGSDEPRVGDLRA